MDPVGGGASGALDEAATDMVMTRLPERLDEFPDAYDHPYDTASRSYLRDLATLDVDLAVAGGSAGAAASSPRRCRVSASRARTADTTGSTRPTSHGRAEIAVAEFAECGGGGAATISLLTAVPRIVEEIWHDDPAATWEKAKKLLAEGYGRHEVLHRLAG